MDGWGASLELPLRPDQLRKRIAVFEKENREMRGGDVWQVYDGRGVWTTASWDGDTLTLKGHLNLKNGYTASLFLQTISNISVYFFRLQRKL